MSVKDTRYKRICPICGDTLPGTDDALEVFEGVKEALNILDHHGGVSPDTGETITQPNCGLCGDMVSIERAREIVAEGEPELLDA